MATATIEYLLRIRDEASAALKDLGDEAGDAEDALKGTDKSAQDLTVSMIKATAVIAAAKIAFQALKGATVGFVSGAIQAGATMESFHTQLTVLMGSAGAAQERLDELFRIGATTPFELPGLIEAEVNLRALGVNAEEMLPLILDFAGAMNVDVAQAAVEVGRAMMFGAGAVETIAGRALRAQVELRTGTNALKMSTTEFRTELITTLTDPNGIFAGGTEKLAATFQGLMSNLSDAWFGFQKSVADADLFTNSKATLKAFLEFMKANQGVIDDFAKAIGTGIGGALLDAAFMAALLVDTLQLAAKDIERLFESDSMLGKIGGIVSPDMLDVLGFMGLGQLETILRVAGAIEDVTGISAALTDELAMQSKEILGSASAFGTLEAALQLVREQAEKFGTSTRDIVTPGVDGEGEGDGPTDEEQIQAIQRTIRVGISGGAISPGGDDSAWRRGALEVKAEERNSLLKNMISNMQSLTDGVIPGDTWWAALINWLAEIGDQEYDLNWQKLGDTLHDAFMGVIKLWFSLDTLFTVIIDAIAFGIRDAVQMFMDERKRWDEPDRTEQSEAINAFNTWFEERTFQTGTKFVDRTGIAMLHQGETVTPAGGATPQRAFGGGGGGLTVNVNAPLGIGPGTAEQLIRELNQILGARGLNLSVA